MKISVIAVIPARYGSTRFPGKSLALINGKPMIQWVYERTQRSRLVKRVIVATDDGSRGFHGSVVDLFHATVARNAILRPKIFACGPNRMLSVVAAAARTIGMDCELSLEGEMACGIGICQGCPVERSREGRKYALVCTDGPTFNSRDVVI